LRKLDVAADGRAVAARETDRHGLWTARDRPCWHTSRLRLALADDAARSVVGESFAGLDADADD
jgi:hypothetical protein